MVLEIWAYRSLGKRLFVTPFRRLFCSKQARQDGKYSLWLLIAVLVFFLSQNWAWETHGPLFSEFFSLLKSVLDALWVSNFNNKSCFVYWHCPHENSSFMWDKNQGHLWFFTSNPSNIYQDLKQCLVNSSYGFYRYYCYHYEGIICCYNYGWKALDRIYTKTLHNGTLQLNLPEHLGPSCAESTDFACFPKGHQRNQPCDEVQESCTGSSLHDFKVIYERYFSYWNSFFFFCLLTAIRAPIETWSSSHTLRWSGETETYLAAPKPINRMKTYLSGFFKEEPPNKTKTKSSWARKKKTKEKK